MKTSVTQFINPCTHRYDVTSKTGTKVPDLKANYHLLASLGQKRRPFFLALKQTEKYLNSVLYPKRNCNALEDLRSIIYTKKKKTV